MQPAVLLDRDPDPYRLLRANLSMLDQMVAEGVIRAATGGPGRGMLRKLNVLNRPQRAPQREPAKVEKRDYRTGPQEKRMGRPGKVTDALGLWTGAYDRRVRT